MSAGGFKSWRLCGFFYVPHIPIGPQVVPFGITCYRILDINHKKGLLRGLWVIIRSGTHNHLASYTLTAPRDLGLGFRV